MSGSSSGKGAALASAGGVLAALASSLCCVVPLVAVIFGVGGAGVGAMLEPYRPLFVGLCAAAFGAGFIQAYKPLPADDCCAGAPSRSRRWSRTMLWVSLPIAVIALGFPSLIGWFAPLPAQARPALASGMARCTMPVAGMTCAGCEGHIEAAFEGVEGVRGARANHKSATATIVYDPKAIDPGLFPALLEEATGYEAEACGPTSDEALAFDPTMRVVCRGGCAAKRDYDEVDVVSQPGARAGDLTRCPISGVVFEVTDDHARVDHGGQEVVLCCAACAEIFKADPGRFSKNLR